MTATIDPETTASGGTTIRVSRTIVAVAGVATLLFDLAVKDGALGLGFALLLVAGAVLCRLIEPRSRFVPLSMIALSPWFVLRDSLALTTLNTGAAITLTGVFIALEPAGLRTRLVDCDRVVVRFIAVVTMSPVSAADLAQPALARRTRFLARTRRAASAWLVGAPVLFAVLGLLAWADQVFASFLRLPSVSGRIAVHALLLACGAWLSVTMLSRRSTRMPPLVDRFHLRRNDPRGPRPLAVSVLLWSLTATIGMFNLNWIVAAISKDNYVQRRTSLTYAQYARQGYFQLLCVSAIVLATLVIAEWVIASSAPGLRAVRHGAWAVAAMNIVLLVGAVYRLNLYFAAFGYTLLRLWCVVFAVCLGGAFIVAIARQHRRLAARVPLVHVVSAAIMAAVVAFSAINPEALVARRNTERSAIDFDYLASLSADADSVVFARLDSLTQRDAVRARAYLCARERPERGLWSWNRSASRAERNDC